MTSLLTKITNRLINFNNALASDEASKFDALHLDLEPQGLTAWDVGTSADKRALLDDLLNAYLDIRAHLDGAGFITMPIYADLPFFFDKLPVDGGSVGWTSAADRDAWFQDVRNVLDGISIMTFSKDNFASIDAAIAYERSALPGDARLGIQPKVGPGELWANISAYNTVMLQCEMNYGPGGSTDIEKYGFWRHAIAASGGLPWVSGVVELAENPDVDGGGVIIIDVRPRHIYIVRESGDMDHWKEITRLRTAQPEGIEKMKVPVSLREDSGFYQVEIVRNP